MLPHVHEEELRLVPEVSLKTVDHRLLPDAPECDTISQSQPWLESVPTSRLTICFLLLRKNFVKTSTYPCKDVARNYDAHRGSILNFSLNCRLIICPNFVFPVRSAGTLDRRIKKKEQHFLGL